MCGACVASQRERQASRYGWVVWALFVLTGLSWLVDSPDSLRHLLTRVSIVYVVSVGLTAIHEGAHALAGLVMGLRVRSISLGAEGPVAFSINRGLFTLLVRVLPIGGLTRFDPATRAFRTRHIVAVIAGPVAELTVVALAWSWDATGWMAVVRWDVLFLGAVSVIMNLLIPLPGRGNDSSKLFLLLRLPDSEIAVTQGMTQRDDIAQRVNDHTMGNPLSQDELEEARDFFLSQLADPAVAGTVRAIVASNLSAVDILTERSDLLPEADKMSAEAFQSLPHPTITANRGSVLIALGRDDEAIPLISRALPDLEGSNRDAAHADLALAAIRRGDLFGARVHFAAVSSLYNAPSTREALRLLGAAELSNILSVYWTNGEEPMEVAAAIRSDAGGDAAHIGHVLHAFSQTAGAPELKALFAEYGHTPPDARVAVEQLVASLEEQR